MSTTILDIVTNFEKALATFISSSAGVVTKFVMPIGWVVSNQRTD